jgi:hypothetical protein
MVEGKNDFYISLLEVNMNKLKHFFTVFFKRYLLLVIFSLLFYPLNAKSTVEIPASKADIIIQGAQFKFFGIGILTLDMNGDGINDYAIVKGVHQPEQMGTNSLYIFDGKDIKKGGVINSLNSSKLILKTAGILGKSKKIYRDRGVGEEGFSTGDFNGDGCDDLMVACFSPVVFYIIPGSTDFFTKISPPKKTKKFGDASVLTIKTKDFKHMYGLEGKILHFFFDINGDKKDDIIIASDEAKHGKMWDAGKVFIFFGKEELPKKINLYKGPDLTIAGDRKKQHLGVAISFRNHPEKGTEMIIRQPDKTYLFPHAEKLSGDQIISKIPNIIHLTGLVDDVEYDDLNNDLKMDLIATTFYSKEKVNKLKKHDLTWYQKYQKKGLFLLCSLVYGKDKPFEAGKNFDEISDISVSFKPRADTTSMMLTKITDLDRDGKLDMVFGEERMNDDLFQYFVYDFLSKGSNLILEDIIDHTTQLQENSVLLILDEHNFNGNEIPERIASQPNASYTPKTPGSKVQKGCGKIYLFFDKSITKESLDKLPDVADLVIYGEQEGEGFGIYHRVTDVDKDGLDDLIILSPYRDYMKGGIKKKNTGAVYIFLGKSIKKY